MSIWYRRVGDHWRPMNRLSRLETDCVFRLLGQMMIMMMKFQQFALLSIFFYTEIYYFDVNPLWVIAMAETRSIPRESTISALTFFWSMPLTSYCDLYVRKKKKVPTNMLLFNFTVHLLANLLRPASFYSDRPFFSFLQNCEIVVIHRWLSFLSSSFIMFVKYALKKKKKLLKLSKVADGSTGCAPAGYYFGKSRDGRSTDWRRCAPVPFFPCPSLLVHSPRSMRTGTRIHQRRPVHTER